MALLHADKVVFYHPWDSFTEFTQGREFATTMGSSIQLAPSPVFISGLLVVGGPAGRSYNNTTPRYVTPAASSVSLTAAFWVSGIATANVEARLGYGRTSMADPRNMIGVRSTATGLLVKGEANNVAATWNTLNLGVLPDVSFIVVRGVPSGGSIYAYLSVNGGVWQSAGSVAGNGWSIGSGVSSDNAFVGSYISNNSSLPLLMDEAVLWLDAPEFTADELNNLYQLAATHGLTMDQYRNQYGIVAFSGSCALVTTGQPGSLTDILPLLAQGCLADSASCDLVVIGVEGPPSGALPLFTHGYLTTNEACGAFVMGNGSISESTPCGLPVTFAPCSGDLRLLLAGFVPRPPSVCPILDPLASIQIGDDLIKIYQSRIDALINQLGKNVLLEFDPIRTPCPNCEFDPIAGRSRNIYKAGGPVPFPRGQKCPFCKGNGFTEEQSTKCIKCLLKWNPQDYAVYGIAANDPKGIVRTKGYLTDAPAIERASSAIVNYDIASVMRLRVKRLRGPVPVGLRQDRYAITFWELVNA